MDIGKDCTGYKTTLTWGVGVASRGKLRGLSLPIANSAKKANASGDDGKDQSTSAPKREVSPTSNPEHLHKTRSADMHLHGFHDSGSLGVGFYPSSAYNPTSPIPVPMPPSQNMWGQVDFNQPLESYNAFAGKQMRMPMRPNPLRRIQTAPAHPYEESVYSTPSSAFSDSDYPSPKDFPATPEDYSIPEPYVGSYSESYPGPPEQLHGADYGYGEPPRSYPTSTVFAMPAMSTSMHSSSNFSVLPSSTSPTAFGDLLQCNNFTPTNETAHAFSVPQGGDQDYFSDGFSDFSVSHVPSSWPAHEPTEPPGLRTLPPRTRFFLQSFDQAICPLLVAVDDRRNPYRLHVTTLISTNMPLQYAMAALVINQTRRRRSSGQSATHRAATSLEPSADEMEYRAKATEAFNTALRHTHAVSTDAILIALLMLCLLSLAETGFGKFKVGLVGVRRLLSSRATDKGSESTLAKWATQWFIWLDIIASVATPTVGGEDERFVEMLHTSASLGSLEYVANCQGRLYRMVAKLADWSMSTSRLTPAKDYYGHSKGSSVQLEQTSTFWAPLQQVQVRLNSYANHPNFHSHDADPVIVDHLEATFRHAAAIYAERQSRSMSEVSSPSMQGLVAEALSAIAAIPANSSISQFLLWPLLIVGSECVDATDREHVRRRVAASTTGMSVGGFSCADVLIKIWSLLDTGFIDDESGETESSWPGLDVLGARAPIWRQAMTTMSYELPLR